MSNITPLRHLGIMKKPKKSAKKNIVLPAPGAPKVHPHTKRALTKIRKLAARLSQLNATSLQILSELTTLAAENDARELKKRPSLKKKRAAKKRR